MFNVKYDQIKQHFYDNNGPLVYTGFHNKKAPDGHGTIYYRNGNELYSGFIKMGNLDGFGIYRMPEGIKIYEGNWKQSLPHGKGLLFDEDYGDILYNGSPSSKYYP
jgi:hypothetical protein